MNEARQDDYIWHSFHLYKILENDPIFSDKKQIGVWGTGWGHHHLYCPGSQKGQREFSKVMSVHYFDCGDGFTHGYTCQNLANCNLKYVVYQTIIMLQQRLLKINQLFLIFCCRPSAKNCYVF